MKGKIALEEHFAFEGTLAGPEYLRGKAAVYPPLKRQLVDLHDERIIRMDQAGIQFAVLSLHAPAAQAMVNPKEALELSRRANDYLAEMVAKRPDRLAGWATLPMVDPEAAARELARCVKDFGFKGVLVNGFSHKENEPESAAYYDEPQYWPFWEEAQKLDTAFYLHPRDPIPSQQSPYSNHPWLLGAAWAYGAETGVHALRLICSGLFDKYPRLKILVGHLGEGLTFHMWRVDHAIARDPRGIHIEKMPSEYWHSNFFLTTSGNFTTMSLVNAVQEMGADHVMFSVDYPYENMEAAAEWFDAASIGENDRLKIGRLNAMKMFNLGVGKSAAGRG